MVSVIIPTYNRSALLKEAIQSVLNQTYRPIECIVVDDGSTDDSAVVMKELGVRNNDDFILKYIVQANAGSQVARNTGIAAATGDYFQFLDSDDLLYPQKIELQVAYLEKHPDCDCVFGDWHSGEPDNYSLMKAYKSSDFIGQIVTNERPLHTLSFLMRRSLVAKTAPWDVTIRRMQEIDFQLSALLAGGHFCYQEQLCGLWRQHDAERIHNKTKVTDMFLFYRKWERILIDSNQFHSTMAEKIANWYMWQVTSASRKPANELVSVLEEIVRLQPAIDFYQAKWLRLLERVVGRRQALYVWLFLFRLHNK